MMRKRWIATITAGLLMTMAVPRAQTPEPRPMFLGLGDSIGEGVQSADASYLTQPFSYLHILSLLMGVPLPMPFIESGLFGTVGSVNGRSRISPEALALNLAVSGADSGDLLFARADALTTAEIDSELDLVLFPRRASQIEIAETLRPELVACWIGSNDALAAVTDYDQLDGFSQLTPLPVFEAHFTEIAARLAAAGGKVVFGTVPNVTRIGYVVSRQDLVRLTGRDHGLPEGSYTTIVTTLAIKLGLLSPTVLADPNFVLDPSEVTNINARIAEFNDVIRTTASTHGMGVAEIGAAFEHWASNPPVLFGVPLESRFLGGLFSLDGAHPSNMGQLIVAMLFVDAFNQHYGLTIPQVNGPILQQFFVADPFIDKDGDGRVTGRFGAGLLETISPLVGWSGDVDDAIPSPTSLEVSSIDAERVIDVVEKATGKKLRHASRHERLALLGELFVRKHGPKSQR
jgi:hypothetical protein